ncbi:transcription elongation factor GreA [Citroniella saccharovorans]|uniref:Transcription elongation factor GreA n=1 Tax=Citroniella saccharovorans TaxID=2053367 RepID=A0AAW9MT54_9FIRM|nr:transcription elongation factor GreA [Citroniella saccharovorans]MEB3429063.1 transcription elongation factor GreA [Citroniella saccharovorans]
MEKEVLLTKEGLKKLEDELNELKTTKRREVAEKIKIARGFGDLSENAEYDEAKLEQAQNEDRVLKIEEMLRNATVIEEDDAKGDIVKIGSKVRLFDKEFDEEVSYTIVGSTEANPMKGLISNVSPVGKGLIGSKVGEEVSILTPGGQVVYKVLEILE